jgi:hypothetical protein
MALHTPVKITFGAPPDRAATAGLPTLTPHAVGLCFLIRGYLSPQANDPGGAWVQRQALGDALLRAMRRADGPREPSLAALAAELAAGVEANLAATAYAETAAEYAASVVDSLRHHTLSVESVFELDALFEALAHMVTTSTNLRAEESVGADDNSVMGFFLRRAWCDYAALPFEGACTLVDAVRAYACERGGVPGEPVAAGRSAFRARLGAERFLAAAAQAAPLRAGAAPRAALDAPLRELAAAAPGLALTSAAAAAVAGAHRDQAAARERWRDFCDRPTDPAAPHVGVVGAGDDPRAAAALASGSTGRHAGGRLQAAALAVGAAHGRLGEAPAALRALGEAVRAAQQAGDDDALAHALAQLCTLLEAATPGSLPAAASAGAVAAAVGAGGGAPGGAPGGVRAADRHLADLAAMLARCLTRAEELRLPHLAAYARLAQARGALMRPPAPPAFAAAGEVDDAGAPPAAAPAPLELAAAARHLAGLHLAVELAAAVPGAPPSGSGFAALRILKGLGDAFSLRFDALGAGTLGAYASTAAEVRRLAGSAALLRAAGWAAHGSARLGATHAAAFLESHGAGARAEDAALALAQAATAAAAAHGFAAADRVLALARRRLPGSQSGALAAARLHVAHARALRRGDLRRAATLVRRLVALGDPTGASDAGLRLDAEEAGARTLLAGGAHAAAERAARAALAFAAAARLPLAAARLLALLARIHLEAGAPAAALPCAEAAERAARAAAADVLAAEAAVLRGLALAALGPPRAAGARAVVEDALPVIFAHGGLDLRGRAKVALAEAALAGAGGDRAAAAAAAPALLTLLSEAVGDFVALEDWRLAARAHHLAARLADAAGDAAGRGRAAAECLRLRAQRAAAFAPRQRV